MKWSTLVNGMISSAMSKLEGGEKHPAWKILDEARGYANEWQEVVEAAELRAQAGTREAPAPAVTPHASDMAEVADLKRERPSPCRKCNGPRNWSGSQPPFCPTCDVAAQGSAGEAPALEGAPLDLGSLPADMAPHAHAFDDWLRNNGSAYAAEERPVTCWRFAFGAFMAGVRHQRRSPQARPMEGGKGVEPSEAEGPCGPGELGAAPALDSDLGLFIMPFGRRAMCIDKDRDFYGWWFHRGPEQGQWVSARKATEAEIKSVEAIRATAAQGSETRSVPPSSAGSNPLPPLSSPERKA
jgi:hypothetical protein